MMTKLNGDISIDDGENIHTVRVYVDEYNIDFEENDLPPGSIKKIIEKYNYDEILNAILYDKILKI